MAIVHDDAEKTTSPLSEALVADWREMFRSWVASWKLALSPKSLPQDALSGLTVAAVALPLNLALAVASGVPPVTGLIAGAIGGVIAGAFGGATLQVTGPAAALSVMVLAISQKFGVTGVALAAMCVGVVQLLLSLSRAGHLAKYVSESVLAGFATGVGFKLLDGQIPELLGFDYRVSELASMMHRPTWLHEVEWLAAICGLAVAFLVVATRTFPRFPAAIVGILGVTFVANYLDWDVTRVGEISAAIPHPSIPSIPEDQWPEFLIAVLPLALLAAVESLLSASTIDRMTKTTTPHHPSLELFGQGLANVAVGVMSGMTVSGVVVRSGVNVQSGGKTRRATILHGIFLALAVIYASQHLAHIPLAALAGLLCVVGFRLIDVTTFRELFAHDKVEALVFVIAAAGTMTGHLMLGLTAALVLHFINQKFFHRAEQSEKAERDRLLRPNVRAVLGIDRAAARKPAHGGTATSKAEWLGNVRGRPVIPASAFIHDQATIIGRVVMGEHVHVAAGSSVRADEGAPFFIGDDTNLQDGVVLHALKDKKVIVAGEAWAIYVGRKVSLAHDALVHGPTYIGDESFVGFKAIVHDSVVGSHCFIGHGAIVVGVELADRRFVPHGAIIDTQDKADALPTTAASQLHFNEDVVDVNRGLAAAYRSEADDSVSPKFETHSLDDGRKKPWHPQWNRNHQKHVF